MSSSKTNSEAKPSRRQDFDFVSLVDSMTAALEASTAAAAELPDKSDMGFHRTLDRKFAKGIDATSARVLKLTNQLLELAVQSPELDANNDGKAKVHAPLDDEDTVVDHFRSSVIDIVDRLLENADSNLDEANGQKKKAAIEVKASLAARAGLKLPGPQAIGSSKTMLPKHISNANYLAKPQLSFRDPVNNSNDQPAWTPTLPTKHHSMVPLEWKPSADDMPHYAADMEPTPEKRERDLRARDHPYFYETKHLPYPTSLFSSAPAIAPKPFEDTPFVFVETPEQLEELTATLKKAKEIAVDLEANSTRSYYGLTCLMQISTRDGDWVVDTLALRAELRDNKLGGVLADPSIVKVFHGADSDIVWLQRDFDLYVVNLFDTYHACKVLEFPQFSLASLLKLYCDFDADKRYQMADWRIRPIPEEMLFYARSDTHFLLYVYDSLRNALIARASRTPSPVDSDGEGTSKPNPQRAIRRVLEKSAETALKLYSRDPYDHDKGIGMNGWGNLAKKLGKKVAADETLFVFQRLHFWRDNIAREMDESPHFVLPNHVLIELARLRPRNAVVLGRKLAHGAPIAETHMVELLEVIRTASEDYAAGVPQAKEVKDVEMKDAAATQATGKGKGKASAVAPAAPAAPAAPVAPVAAKVDEERSTKRAKTTPTPPTADIWAETIMGKSTGRAASSSLFGGKAAGKAPAQPSGQAPAGKSAVASSLFGSTLSKKSGKNATAKKPSAVGMGTTARSTRTTSPGFTAIQAAIHGELVASSSNASKANSNPVEPNESSVMPNGAVSVSAVAEPETVEFVPAAKRTIAPSDLASSAGASTATRDATRDALDSSTAPGVRPRAAVNAEGIVAVKKKRNKKDKKAATAAAAAAAVVVPEGSSEASTPAPTPAAAPEQKKQKQRIQADAIPEFDYAAVPDLLDDPTAGSRFKPKGKKKKQANDKKKGPANDIDTSAFRRAPSDPSQPKAGNKSGTFTR